jgi:probable rRNA maturation factor
VKTTATRQTSPREADITVQVESADWRKSVSNPVRTVRSAAMAALWSALGEDSSSLAILLSDDARLAALNQNFRGKQGPTNVLSFPAAKNSEHYLGDIAIAHGVCAREAAERGIPLNRHLAHLVVHGVLHLLGYDHETERQARIMEPLETKILAGMKIPDPYSMQLANP